MENQITIDTILFESNDAEILVKGSMNKGVMQYPTELIITHSQLNMILNQLQKQNDEISVHDHLCAEKMYNDETLYTLNCSDFGHRMIGLDSIAQQQSLKQIRA